MKTIPKLLLSSCAASLPALLAGASPERPNIIFILADDLGYGELGCYGQKIIETPNIDRLAADGIRFTQHYSGAPVSAPSRSALLTGLHTGHTPVRGNDEMTGRGDVWSFEAMLRDPGLEGQWPLPAGTRTLGHMLQEQGYSTAMVGKWGLGYPGSRSTPNRMGFDHFFGYNCQRQAHVYYPMFLYRNDERVYYDNAPMQVPTEKFPAGADPCDAAEYERYIRKVYSGDVMFEEVTRFVDENAGNPFFLMWTTPLPHVSLQAPREWVNYYVEKMGDETPFGGGGYLPARYPRATYAAMISYLDAQIGALAEQLREKGIYENTIIVFTSDNGPTYSGGTDSPFFNSGGPFNSARGWGKTSLREGGIRVPMIFSWPAVIKEPRQSDLVSAFWDFAPTFAAITGADAGATDGISFADELYGRPQREHPFLYWEYPEGKGSKAVRAGKWKLLVREIRSGAPKLSLYNIETDPREQFDRSAEYPEVVAAMLEIMEREHSEPENPNFRMPGVTPR